MNCGAPREIAERLPVWKAAPLLEAWVGIEPAYADLQSGPRFKLGQRFRLSAAPQNGQQPLSETIVPQGPLCDCGAGFASAEPVVVAGQRVTYRILMPSDGAVRLTRTE